MTATMATAPYLDNSFRVGRASLADEALYIYASEPIPYDGSTYPDYPEWEYLDCGSYRVVMLHVPTQVVYKIPFSEDYDYPDTGANTLAELESWRRMLAHEEYAPFVPEHQAHAAMFNGKWVYVMAMPYLGEQPALAQWSDFPNALGEAADHAGCGDIGRRNVRKQGDRWYLIDAGGSTGDYLDHLEYEQSGCMQCNPAGVRHENA